MYAAFTHDVQGGEDLSNPAIAKELIKMGLLKQELAGSAFRFLEKVSQLIELT